MGVCVHELHLFHNFTEAADINDNFQEGNPSSITIQNTVHELVMVSQLLITIHEQ